MKHLDLFSGIGGFALAAQRCGFQTIAFCEIEPYAQKVLIEKFAAVMADSASVESWTGRPARREAGQETGMERPKLFGDIRKLDGRQFAGVDLLTGGFPCQPFSQAGKRRGKADDRHLWPEMLRVISEARPAWILGENVAGIVSMELDGVLSDLEGEGYSCRPFIIPACAVDAKHRRDRVWIVAHAGSDSRGNRGQGGCDNHDGTKAAPDCQERTQRKHGAWQDGSIMADTNEQGPQGRNCQELSERGPKRAARQSSSPVSHNQGIGRNERNTNTGRNSEGEIASLQWTGLGNSCRWLPEPGMGRVAHGIPHRSHRLKALGNAIVPQVAYVILKAIAANRLSQEVLAL